MFATLSSSSRETASIFRSSEPVVCRQPAPLEDRVLRVERERDEGEEAAGLVLLGAQPEQVVDPLLVRLDVAVEHRAVRRDPEPVRRVVGAEPEVRMLLAGRDELAHAVGEDLGAAARQRAEAGGLQLAQHLLVREARERRHVVDLGRRVELEVHVRQRLLQRADRVDVELEVDVRVLAVDHVDLGEAGQLVLADRVLDELRRRDRVRLLLLARARRRRRTCTSRGRRSSGSGRGSGRSRPRRCRRAAVATGRRARRARAGRRSRGARARPRSRAAHRPRPSRGSARAWSVRASVCH